MSVSDNSLFLSCSLPLSSTVHHQIPTYCYCHATHSTAFELPANSYHITNYLLSAIIIHGNRRAKFICPKDIPNLPKDKSLAIIIQKVTLHTTIGDLLRCKSWPFKILSQYCWQSMGYRTTHNGILSTCENRRNVLPFRGKRYSNRHGSSIISSVANVKKGNDIYPSSMICDCHIYFSRKLLSTTLTLENAINALAHEGVICQSMPKA